ncbi:MAG TPA: CHAT domain-containing protein [Pyrinomonadaceae bacterium]
MSQLNLRPHFWRVSLFILLATLSPFATWAQTVDEEAIGKMLLDGYRAYAKRDAAALFSLFSERSPYLPEFKLYFQQEFSRNEKTRIESMRVNLLRKIVFENDKATARVYTEIKATDTDTGRPAEGFGETDHTIRFVREDGVWKVWHFADTAEELTLALLAAKTEDEVAAIIKEKGEPITGGLLQGLKNQAETYLEVKGSYAQAEALYNIILKISRQINSQLGIANALVGLGDVYAAQGDYLRAANNYQTIMKLAEALGSKEAIAAMSVKLGNIHYHQGNFTQALAYYQRSAQGYEELGSKVQITYPLYSIGNAYFAQGNYPQALAYFQRSLKIYEQIFDKAGTAHLLNKLGDVYTAEGDDTRALDYYQRSLKLHEELGNRAQIAYSLNGIGNVRYLRGDFQGAAEFSSRAVDLTRESYTPEILWRALTSQGRARRALNQVDKARQAFSDAVAVIEKLRHQVAGGEEDRQRFFEGRIAPYNALVDLLIAQNELPMAFTYAERSKGRILLDVLRNGRVDISSALSAEEREQELSLNAAITALNSQLKRESLKLNSDKSRISEIETQLKKARLDYDAFQTRAYAKHPGLKTQRGETEPLTLDEAGELIPDTRTALLEYVVTDERSYLFVLTRNEKGRRGDANGVELKVYPINIKAQALASRVLDFRQKLANNSLGFREPAEQLYDLLLRPAQQELAGKTNICIVPAGPLWELPFQALQSSPSRYLLEDSSLFYVHSLSVLREMKRKAVEISRRNPLEERSVDRLTTIKTSAGETPHAQTLLAFGNPSLSNNLIAQAKSVDRDLPLSPLPEAEREVRGLGEIYGPRTSKVLTGMAAQEETVKAEAGKYQILHFATHGTLDNDNPLYSRLLLASSTSAEDGFLEAREIMKLKLRADLAVLSACQTARGHVSAGEGLIGISWALFVAGTPTTVASQWKVDSASTARLMLDFHRYLTARQSQDRSGTNKAEALRRAALKLLSDPKYKHPFYWAGFIVVGNGI